MTTIKITKTYHLTAKDIADLLGITENCVVSIEFRKAVCDNHPGGEDNEAEVILTAEVR